MDFRVSKIDFNTALRQILLGRKPDSPDFVDMTTEHDSLTVVVTGRSIEVPVESMEQGSFSIPIGVLFKLKRISGTFQVKTFRVRVKEGSIRLESMSISNPGIKARPISRRIIDIPEDATRLDLLSLAFIFSMDEIEDCGLHAKLLEAQQKLGDHLTSAYETLRSYGFTRDELRVVAEQKIKARSEVMKTTLFPQDKDDSNEPPISYAEWLERERAGHSGPSPSDRTEGHKDESQT